MLKIISVFCLAFKETIMEYLKNTSLSGFHLLHYISSKKYQRIFWSLFLLAGIISASYVTFVSVQNILEKPTVTTLDSNRYNIEKVPFSAVAICSVNKFSRSAANAFVEEMRKKFGLQISHQLLLQKMKLFGGLFDYGSVDFKEAKAFQREFLDKYDINIKETLNKLAPRCEDLIIKCRWGGKIQECSELLEKHFTAYGSCCIFNYVRAANKSNLKYIEGAGIRQGLTLLLNTSKDDYFLTDRSFAGFTVLLFNFGEFPDKSIGGTVQESFVPQGSATELQISAILQTATSEMKIYNLKQRQCFLYAENVAGDDDLYSTDKCMTRCKVYGMLRICGCVPYYTPSDFLDRSDSNVTYCTLAHVECLYRNRVILNTYSLVDSGKSGAVTNRSLQCSQCLPQCNFNLYNLRHQTTLLKNTYLLSANQEFLKLIGRQDSGDKFNYTYESLITMIKHTNNLSIVKIYFHSLHAVLFSKRSLYEWYEILSNIGGVIGIFMGCSLVSAFEVLYFFILKLINNIRKYY